MVTRRAVALYIVASVAATLLFIADNANTYRAFYPTMVALANSSSFRLLIVNAVVAGGILVWFAMQMVFFGKLNASEESALLTSFTIYLAECIVVPLYFNLTLMSTTMVFFAFTLVWRLLHKLATERVTTLSTVPMTLFPITRMVAYLNFAIICDVGLLLWLVRTRPDMSNEKASLHYSLLLIYMLLVTSSLRSAVRFGSLFVLRGPHTLLPFVADAVTSIAESTLFVAVYAYIFMKSTLPLLLLRGFISHLLRIFEKASGLAEFLVLARRVRHDMPDATAEDLARDARCTICYEDMEPGGGTKRLPCGHCYHTQCLEHWLEGHSTCPYCRANIMNMPSAQADANAAAGADGADGGAAAAAGGEGDAAPAAAAALPEGIAAADVAAGPRDHPSPAEDRLAIRRRIAATQRAVDHSEAELRAAYERYLRRVQNTAAMEEAEEHRRAAGASRPAGAVEDTAASAAPRLSRPLSPPPLLSEPLTGPSTPRQAPTPSSDGATVSATNATVSSGPASPFKTVEQLKLKAYKKYHKRLREAEKELSVALKLAEEMGV